MTKGSGLPETSTMGVGIELVLHPLEKKGVKEVNSIHHCSQYLTVVALSAM